MMTTVQACTAVGVCNAFWRPSAWKGGRGGRGRGNMNMKRPRQNVT